MFYISLKLYDGVFLVSYSVLLCIFGCQYFVGGGFHDPPSPQSSISAQNQEAAMIAPCRKCGKLVEITTEEAYTPVWCCSGFDRYCLDCHDEFYREELLRKEESL